MSNFFAIREHVIPAQHVREYPGATLNDQEEELSLHVKQYTPLGGPRGSSHIITILAAHANGFPKELYEPMWEAMCRNFEASGVAVRGIWIADVTHQGQSGILNAEQLGNDPHWNDHARDMLLMSNHFRKEMVRPIVGIGHSMGGNTLVNLSLIHPRLLSSLILIDPVILSPERSRVSQGDGNNPTLSLGRLSTFRRDKWASREAAEASFQQSKFYQNWDPRVLELWIQYGLREENPPSGTGLSQSERSVTLATSKHQEVFTFQRPEFSRGPESLSESLLMPDRDPHIISEFRFYRPEPPLTFEQLPHLRPPTLYLFGGQSALSAPDSRRERVERTGIGVGGSGGEATGQVKQFVMEHGGHLMPMEQVKETADVCTSFLQEKLEEWAKHENEWTAWWRARAKPEKTLITKEWENAVLDNPTAADKAKQRL